MPRPTGYSVFLTPVEVTGARIDAFPSGPRKKMGYLKRNERWNEGDEERREGNEEKVVLSERPTFPLSGGLPKKGQTSGSSGSQQG